jgi:hypothetical protein
MCMPTQCVNRSHATTALSRSLGLPEATVGRIVDRLAFDTRTNSPDVYQQPLFTNQQKLAWSPRVVAHSRGRRNLLKLMARSGYSDQIANIIGRLEISTIDRLRTRLCKAGYSVRSDLPVRSSAERGQIDLVAWHPQAPTEILIVEVKGCLPADEVNEVDGTTEDARAGQAQLEKVCRILEYLRLRDQHSYGQTIPWPRVRTMCGLVLLYEGTTNSNYSHAVIPCVDLAVFLNQVRSSDIRSPARIVARCREKPWLNELRSQPDEWHSVTIADVTYELPIYKNEVTRSRRARWHPRHRSGHGSPFGR